MKKMMPKEISKMDFGGFDPGFITNVENFKRRRALQSFWSLDISSKMFFQRALHIKRNSEFVFITKAQSKSH